MLEGNLSERRTGVFNNRCKMHQASAGTEGKYELARQAKSTTILELARAATGFQNYWCHGARKRADGVSYTATVAPFSRPPPKMTGASIKKRGTVLLHSQINQPCALWMGRCRAESLASPAVEPSKQ